MEQRREVLGFDGQVVVVGPEDRLVVVLPQTTVEIAQEVSRKVREVFGDGRSVVLAGDVRIAVERVLSAPRHGLEIGQIRGGEDLVGAKTVVEIVEVGSVWASVAVSVFDPLGSLVRTELLQQLSSDTVLNRWPMIITDESEPPWPEMAIDHATSVRRVLSGTRWNPQNRWWGIGVGQLRGSVSFSSWKITEVTRQMTGSFVDVIESTWVREGDRQRFVSMSRRLAVPVDDVAGEMPSLIGDAEFVDPAWRELVSLHDAEARRRYGWDRVGSKEE